MTTKITPKLSVQRHLWQSETDPAKRARLAIAYADALAALPPPAAPDPALNKAAAPAPKSGVVARRPVRRAATTGRVTRRAPVGRAGTVTRKAVGTVARRAPAGTVVRKVKVTRHVTRRVKRAGDGAR